MIWTLQPNFYQWARWLTISAKPLIALEIDLSFFKPWCSSFQGKLESPGKGATWGRQCWPAAAHMQSHPGGSLWAHMHVYTRQHIRWRPVQLPWVQVQTETSQNSSGSKYAADQAFLAISVPLSSPSPARKDYVSLLSFISNSGGNSNYSTSISFAPSITHGLLHTFSQVAS